MKRGSSSSLWKRPAGSTNSATRCRSDQLDLSLAAAQKKSADAEWKHAFHYSVPHIFSRDIGRDIGSARMTASAVARAAEWVD